MYTYKPRTVEQIKADIADLQARLDRAHDDDLPDLQDDIESLGDELDEALAAEPIPDRHAPTGGLNLPLVGKAFASIPEDWDEGFLP
jgi:hypothetical protein